MSPANGSEDRPGPRPWSDEEDVALRLWIALARSYQTFSRAVTSRVAEHGLTLPQFGVLEALHHLGPLPLGELAGKLLVTSGNVTYVMDRLEREGLVCRSRSGEDRRVIVGSLTPAGRAIVEEVFPAHASFIAELAATLDPEERDDLRRLLKKLGKGVAARERTG